MNSTRTCVTPPREPIIEWHVISCVWLKRLHFETPSIPPLFWLLVVCLAFDASWDSWAGGDAVG